ncbi:MAG: hypothetical protein QW778_05255, partial [Candidatus Micrarchaeaceae archaeon]
MRFLSDKLKKVRSLIVNSIANPVLICRENPLFEYFSDDPRADCIQIMNFNIYYIGSKDINASFEEPDPKSCLVQPYFSQRKLKACEISLEDLFQFPLSDEIRAISQFKGKLQEIIVSSLSEGSAELTEEQISNIIREKICSLGVKMFYEPIVAFDNNIQEIWHKPESKSVGKAGYVEVSSSVDGLSSLFSETFLFS